MRNETSKFRTPRLPVEDTATEACGTERMSAAGGAKTEAVSHTQETMAVGTWGAWGTLASSTLSRSSCAVTRRWQAAG